MRRRIPLLRALAGAALLALAGCASLPPGAGQDGVRRMVQERGQATPAVAPSARERHLADLLAKPLTAEDAVNIALLNNRSLQAGYAGLDIAGADLVQAGRLSNPVLSFSRLSGRDGVAIERKLMLPVIGLLLMPVTRPLEQRRFELAQMQAAGDVLRVADATRRAWYGAVAAQQSALYMEQVKDAAEASFELARRMAAAGNWSALQQAREQAFYADAVAQLARAPNRQRRTRAAHPPDGSGRPERLPAARPPARPAGHGAPIWRRRHASDGQPA